MRMQSHRPLPDAKHDRHGPEWQLNTIHQHITVAYCHVPECPHAPLLDLEIWLAQTEGCANANPAWRESYFNLLTRIMEGLLGFGQTLRIGDPIPMAVTASAETRDYRRVLVPETRVSFCVPKAWRARRQEQGVQTIYSWHDPERGGSFNLLVAPAIAATMSPPPPPYKVMGTRLVDGVPAVEAILQQPGYESRKLGLVHDGKEFFWTFPISGRHEHYTHIWDEVIHSIKVTEIDAEELSATTATPGCLAPVILGLLTLGALWSL
jgi:hypothetical protein